MYEEDVNEDLELRDEDLLLLLLLLFLDGLLLRLLFTGLLVRGADGRYELPRCIFRCLDVDLLLKFRGGVRDLPLESGERDFRALDTKGFGTYGLVIFEVAHATRTPSMNALFICSTAASASFCVMYVI